MTVRTTHRAKESRFDRGTAWLGSLVCAVLTAGVVIINSVWATTTAGLGIILALVLVL